MEVDAHTVGARVVNEHYLGQRSHVEEGSSRVEGRASQ